MKLQAYVKEELIFIADSFKDTSHFYADFAQFLKNRGVIPDPRKIKRLFVKRESVGSTAIGRRVAAPHIYAEDFAQFVVAVALIRQGLEYRAPDREKVCLVFLIMSDEREVGLHLKALAHVARLTKSTDVVEAALAASGPGDVLRAILEKEESLF